MIKKLSEESLYKTLETYFVEALKTAGLRSFSFSAHVKNLVYFNGDEPVSILVYRLVDEKQKVIEIDFVATISAHREKGFAQALIYKLDASEIWLELNEKNEGALKFYKNLGFEVVGKRLNYYQNGCAALNMAYKRAK